MEHFEGLGGPYQCNKYVYVSIMPSTLNNHHFVMYMFTESSMDSMGNDVEFTQEHTGGVTRTTGRPLEVPHKKNARNSSESQPTTMANEEMGWEG